MTTTPLTPESEDAVAYWMSDGDDIHRDAFRKDMRLIEAAAIARDRAGLVEVVARNISLKLFGYPSWEVEDESYRESHRREARRLLALDALDEAQS